jgi:hypothetical protein
VRHATAIGVFRARNAFARSEVAHGVARASAVGWRVTGCDLVTGALFATLAFGAVVVEQALDAAL